MMKNLSLLLLFVFPAIAAGAQEVSFGAKGGLNLAKVTGTDNGKTRASIHIGAFARIGLTEEWSIQPELVYSGQGYKWDPPVLEDVNFAVNYINLPVMLQYHIIPEFHLEAGPQIGFRVAAKAKNDGDALDIKDATKGIDFGLGFGLGYTFDMGLGVGARYNFGLTNIWDDSRDSGANSVAQIGVFYVFGKKKF